MANASCSNMEVTIDNNHSHQTVVININQLCPVVVTDNNQVHQTVVADNNQLRVHQLRVVLIVHVTSLCALHQLVVTIVLVLDEAFLPSFLPG